MLKRFSEDMKKYWNYTKYAVKSELKGETANSHLGWLWWFLDPLLFMLVYTFIAEVIFNKSLPYFPIYVFIGLQCWNFFSKTVKGSVKLVRANKNIIAKVYLPKIILVLIKLFVNAFKVVVSFLIIAIMMLVYQVPIDGHIFYAIPLLIGLVFLTFGCSAIVLHFGVYVEDLYNVITVVLQLCFYMTGIFYSIKDTVSEPYNMLLLNGNPVAYLIYEIRNCILYKGTPNMLVYFVWLGASLVICLFGIHLVYKNENNYVKSI